MAVLRVADSLWESLTPSVRSSLRPRRENRSTDAHGWDEVIVGYDTVAPCEDREAVISSLSRAEGVCVRMSGADVLQRLAALKALTVPRNATADDVAFQAKLYARLLSDYPADVVRYVLETQPGVSKWWPAWAELKERLDLYAGHRTLLRDALRRLAG